MSTTNQLWAHAFGRLCPYRYAASLTIGFLFGTIQARKRSSDLYIETFTLSDRMQSIDLIRDNLTKSAGRVLLRVKEMQDHCMVFPTLNGGCHTLWILGHLAYIESLVIHDFLLAETNPLSDWQDIFDGTEVSGDINQFPPFDKVLSTCYQVRESTITLLDSLTEEDLDKPSLNTPKGYEDTFGTYRLCFQYLADHWYMHRGQLADARRVAGLDRMWL